MKRSSRRILTTHVGSLVRPPEMVEILQRKEDGKPFSEGERAVLARHVADAVRMQAECGIDIASDGEYSKIFPPPCTSISQPGVITWR